MTDVRCVWLTREQRDLLESTPALDIKRADALEDIAWAWDAAPADSVQVVAEVLYGRDQAMPVAVLRALGMPE